MNKIGVEVAKVGAEVAWSSGCVSDACPIRFAATPAKAVKGRERNIIFMAMLKDLLIDCRDQMNVNARLDREKDAGIYIKKSHHIGPCNAPSIEACINSRSHWSSKNE